MSRERRWGSGTPKHIKGVLDIGTSKVACLIASVVDAGESDDAPASPRMRILGVGHQRAEGIKGGVVIDLDRAEQAVRAAVAQAERMAGVELTEVHLSVSCGRLKSHNFAARAEIAGGVVREADLGRMLDAGRTFAEQGGRSLVDMNEVALRIDGVPGARDPRGLAAREIAIDLHAVTADEAPLRNLLMVVRRCYLEVASLVAAPYASALAVTSEDERRLGVTAIDIGAGATSFAMFAEDRFVHAGAAPLGGAQITFDIARSLHTPLAEAERIKALYGTVIGAPSDERDVFFYPAAGEEDAVTHQRTRAELVDVVRPRVKAIVDHIRERLESCELSALAGRALVLTGGTSQMTGLADFAAAELGRPVRVARPQVVSGLPPALSSSAFSTVVGLLLADTQARAGRWIYQGRDTQSESYLKRVGSWLREGF
ncbi:cell division protein FtsA [Hyphomicrobium sp.]|uniref:cell division protein FtsA n=1 Tax=Hyphomicrobium sp. TaxID=82 RepID=UPI002BE2FA1B|nr:cell division protein FtsA [Hyphomicrobium sp.]HRN88240.1 cell division protein FtsA [Hyphomicrobium sp.]HRQ27417.1 cell division protein FtsA [Hyphomicrobium sp.]